MAFNVSLKVDYQICVYKYTHIYFNMQISPKIYHSIIKFITPSLPSLLEMKNNKIYHFSNS